MTEQELEIQQRRERLNQQGEAFQKAKPFKVKKRHMIVKGLKVFFPLVVISFVSVFFIWPYIQKSMEKQVSVEAIKLNPVGDVEMINPVYQAYDENKNPYNIMAQKAKRDIEEPDLLILEQPRAKLVAENDKTFELTANRGDYQQDLGALVLSGDVLLFEDEGYELAAKMLSIDLQEGVAMSDSPVYGRGPHGNISSEGLMIDKNQNKVIFEGKTKIILQ